MSYFYRRSHWTDWVTTHQIGLESARKLGDHRAEAWILNNLGMAYGVQRMRESANCFQQAATLFDEIGDEPGKIRATNNLANTYLSLGRFEQAKDACESVLHLTRSLNRSYSEAIALNILGSAYRELGQLGEAIDRLQQSLAIFRATGSRDGEADSLSELGQTYLCLDRVDEATRCLHQSVSILRGIGDRFGQAGTLRRLAQAYRQADDRKRGHASLAEALCLYKELGENEYAAVVSAELAELALSRTEDR
jgi:tetratricopeptide (TPR) repeat protein